jgi:hypothetical protein
VRYIAPGAPNGASTRSTVPAPAQSEATLAASGGDVEAAGAPVDATVVGALA